MALQNISKQNISDEVYQQFMEAIMSGEWKPDYKIPSETELASMLNVSRVTVRGALQRLEGMHLIERRQGEGTFVSHISGSTYARNLVPLVALGNHDLQNLMEFREIFDCEVTALAARRGDAELVRRLRENYTEHMSCGEDYNQAAAYDTAFHYMLAKATGNSLIIQIYKTFRPIFERNMVEIVKKMGTGDARRYHAAIIDAVERRDEVTAREIMREHVHNTALAVGQ